MLQFLTVLSESRRRISVPPKHLESNGNAEIMDQMIQKGLSMRGHNTYTQSSLRTNVFSEPGYSDCSSFCWKMYEKFFGIYVGCWTGEQVTKGSRVLLGNGYMVTSDNLKSLKKGDLLFYGGGNAQHVELYIGNNQQLGHGSGMGPTLKTTTSYRHSAGFYQARRYVNIGSGGSSSSSSSSSSSTFKSKGKCTCTGDGVNIRNAAWGTVIGSANKGTTMEYDGTKSGEFYRIRLNGVIGYIHQDYVSISSSSSSSSSGFQSKGTCKCTGDGVRIRASAWGTTLTYVYKGTSMQYDGKKDGDFVHVKVNGIIGYIHKDYVQY